MSSAYFFNLDTEIVSNGSHPKFAKRQPEKDKFFRSPITSSIEIWETEQIDGWQFTQVRFFSGNFVRHVAIADNQTGTFVGIDDCRIRMTSVFNSKEFSKFSCSKLIWLGGTEDPSIYKSISEFLRQSTTLVKADFEYVNKNLFVADGTGIAVVFESKPYDLRASRLQLVVALACAYQSILIEAIDDLATAADKYSNQAEKKIREWSKFLSAYYFKEPINPSSIELIYFYEKIRERQRIDSQYQEITNQLKLLAELVHIDRAEAAQKQSEKTAIEFAKQSAISTEKATENARLLQEQSIKIADQSRVISSRGFWVTLFAAVLALLSITQVTPKSLSDFTQGWTCAFSQLANASVACKTSADPKEQVSELPVVKKKIKDIKK
jgi:hypothetical protein